MLTQEYHSTAHVCGLLQRTPRAISRAAETLGIVPALTLNGVSHYNAEQLEAIAQHFREEDSK